MNYVTAVSKSYTHHYMSEVFKPGPFPWVRITIKSYINSAIAANVS